MTFDPASFIKNSSNFPLDELAKYAGQWVAWSPDGSAILAGSAQSQEAVVDLVRRAGHDPSQCVFDYIPGPDEVILSTFLGQ